MMNSRLEKLARLLVKYSVEIKAGELVSIHGSVASLPLIREIYKAVLSSRAFPRVEVLFEDKDYLFYKYAQKEQLDYLDPVRLYETEKVDAVIAIFPDLNPHSLTSIDADRKQRRMQAMKPITDLFFKRWGEKSLRWVGTAYPTPAMAQEAHMSFSEYTEFVSNCGHLDENDPIAWWQTFSRNQESICLKLNEVSDMEYIGEDTHLKFSVRNRKWINCDGKVNFPDGEVFTGPVENSVNGTIRFSFPGIFQGEEIENIFLRLADGEVVEARADKGESLLHHLLDADQGAKRVGEIAIGTNSEINRFTKNMLFDEKMGGTIHMALGRGIPETGSRNKSVIHWDMLKDMKNGGKIIADGELIYENGKFVEGFC